jgi:hypothetical protein
VPAIDANNPREIRELFEAALESIGWELPPWELVNLMSSFSALRNASEPPGRGETDRRPLNDRTAYDLRERTSPGLFAGRRQRRRHIHNLEEPATAARARLVNHRLAATCEAIGPGAACERTGNAGRVVITAGDAIEPWWPFADLSGHLLERGFVGDRGAQVRFRLGSATGAADRR